MRRQAGFSLMEVLAALALLALLLVGVYSGVRTATRSVNGGTARIERLDRVRSAQQFLRRELAQAMAQPLGRDARGDAIYFRGEPHKLQFVAPLPGYLGKLGPQMQTLELVDNDKGGKRLQIRFETPSANGDSQAPDTAVSDTPAQVLLDDVTEARFSYRGRDAQGQVGPWQASWADGRRLPSLVRIQLDAGVGAYWPQLLAPLRVDPTANRTLQGPSRGMRMRPVGQ